MKKWFDFKNRAPKKVDHRRPAPKFLFKYSNPTASSKASMFVGADTRLAYKKELRLAMNAIRREYDKIVREERRK